MGVLYHLQGHIPQLGGYHHSKDHLIQDLSSLWQDHQILRLCHRDLPWDCCSLELRLIPISERLFLLVPLNHPFNPQHLAAVRGFELTKTHLAVYSGKCWSKELVLKINRISELIPQRVGLWILQEIILCIILTQTLLAHTHQEWEAFQSLPHLLHSL